MPRLGLSKMSSNVLNVTRILPGRKGNTGSSHAVDFFFSLPLSPFAPSIWLSAVWDFISSLVSTLSCEVCRHRIPAPDLPQLPGMLAGPVVLVRCGCQQRVVCRCEETHHLSDGEDGRCQTARRISNKPLCGNVSLKLQIQRSVGEGPRD